MWTSERDDRDEEPAAIGGNAAHNNGPYVLVIGKAIAALDSFLDGERELTLAQIAKRMRMSRSTVHRLMVTLERHRIVERTESGAYRLGIHLFRLGSAVDVRASLGRLAEPCLRSLAEGERVTSYLSIRDGDRAVCVERVDGGGVRLAAYQVGETLPLYVGAGPVVLLSALADEEIDRILARPLIPAGRDLVVDPAAVRARLALIRSSGVASADDDVEVGVVALGAPVYDHAGRMIAAVSVTILAQQLTAERRVELTDALRRTATAIGLELATRDSQRRASTEGV